ncbi:hypothetical protein MY04_2658 [Flammeovirga sp. MY04]|uniref:hypothetical protein n=1 Tax=Flammeovirga sp. MY04 TaxID=1191459 RepID=UPI000806247E|nr:hypothetical protein [Flammeovirga sp. MY04]ANQ50027.1 hypothetical protein MY04_2658 [Flammeovirga sp. MY04]
MRKFLSHKISIQLMISMMAFHLFNVSVNVNDDLLPDEMENEIESIFELISVYAFDSDGTFSDNPSSEDENKTVVGVINITWFMNAATIIPSNPLDKDELPTDQSLPIARPLFYSNPTFSIDTPPPKHV